MTTQRLESNYRSQVTLSASREWERWGAHLSIGGPQDVEDGGDVFEEGGGETVAERMQDLVDQQKSQRFCVLRLKHETAHRSCDFRILQRRLRSSAAQNAPLRCEA